MKKILIISDVWSHINGVVTSLKQLQKGLKPKGYKVGIIHPDEFKNIPLPTYPEIRLAMPSRRKMEKIIKEFNPDYIHIATEGPLGLIARLACTKNKWKFTSQYHTQLPEYIEVRTGMFKDVTYHYMRWFHKPSQCTMVSSPMMKNILEKKKFKHIKLVPVGVDTDLFKKNPKAKIPENFKKPIFAFVGRIAPEKNLEVFLNSRLPGTKLIIGDGPDRKKLERKYRKSAIFTGIKKGRELVDLLSISDVFVFPSDTDTFGIAMLEALSCGLPVAAFNVPGPRDIITNGKEGYAGENLEKNALKCLKLNTRFCRKKALKFSSRNWLKNFIKNLVHI